MRLIALVSALAVLLHGTSASLHTWEGWAAALDRTRRVITMDLPGFGLTGPDPEGDYRIARYVRFVTGPLDALGVRRCVIGGNSLGGEIAWNVALEAPQRVAALILVDAAGYAFESKSVPLGFRIARIPAFSWLAAHLLPRGLIEASVRNVYGDPARVTDALVDRYYELTLRAGNRRAVGERFARDIKGGVLVRFGGLGHVPQEEDPQRTVAAVEKFLSGGTR